MRRQIVKIDEEKCTGCGQCVTACVEGAIEIVDGKARLVSDTYCDGLGACLGECPEDAITIEEREAASFDEAAAMEHAGHTPAPSHPTESTGFTCPGTAARVIDRPKSKAPAGPSEVQSELTHWPVQLALVNPAVPWIENADLILAADCVPFAMADFHQKLLRDHAVVVGCPKLDDVDFYVERLTEILRDASVKSLTVVHMEVPCCFGLGQIAQRALAACGKDIPLRDVTIGIDGEVK